MSKKVGIVYGWAEGPWEAKQFIQQVKISGYEVTQDLVSADILIAHSLGCFLIPANSRAKLILLIGMPM